MAASVIKVEAPKPLPQKRKLYVGRAIGAVFLGDLLGFTTMWVIVGDASVSTLDWIFLFLLGAMFSAGLMPLFVKTDLKANAILGAALAVTIPLSLFVLSRVFQ
jgi:hypothetical protein